MREVWNRPAEPVQQLAKSSGSTIPTPSDNDTHLVRKAVPKEGDMTLQAPIDILSPRSPFWSLSMPCRLDVVKEIWNAIPSYVKGASCVFVGNGVLFLFICLITLTLCF
jgi:hypothetical protein